MSDYPEHDKLAAIQAQSQAIGEFLENSPYVLGEWIEFTDSPGKQFVPVSRNLTEILAGYFEIDLNAIEREKRAMLDEIRRASALAGAIEATRPS